MPERSGSWSVFKTRAAARSPMKRLRPNLLPMLLPWWNRSLQRQPRANRTLGLPQALGRRGAAKRAK